MRRRLRWSDEPRRRAPRRPYRDTAIVSGVFAVVIVLIGWLTGGGLVRSAIIGGAFYIAATAWSWRTWRSRLRGETRQR